MGELAPADADMFWRSRHRVNDQFLLYCFSLRPTSLVERSRDQTPGGAGDRRRVLDSLRRRAEAVDELHLRVAPAPADLAFPRWCPAPIDDDAFVVHDGADTWDRCRAQVAGLLTEGLEATVRPWRLHLLGPSTGAPCADGPVWVVVFQVSHALADGRGASALARALFGGSVPPGAVPAARPPGVLAAVGGALQVPVRVAAGLGLGLLSWSGDGPRTAGPDPLPASVFNRPAGPRRRIDVIVTDVDTLRAAAGGDARRPAVTVAFLSVLADVLSECLGDAAPELAVELTVGHSLAAGPGPPDRRWGSLRWLSERSPSTELRSHESKPPTKKRSVSQPRNDFHNVTIRLRADLEFPERVAAVAAEIADARAGDRRSGLAAWAQRRAAEITPPVLRALAARLSATGEAPSYVAGATVVSSVNRGPADLTLDGGEVLFTAGFPALSAAHAMTIGLHGLGSTVTISVTSDPDAVPDAASVIDLLTKAISP
ncbi:WS/DGAT domain-containing protein [Gordonia iterans]|nr:WS/DGAT domain-containing protein [Gordonia iterans]